MTNNLPDNELIISRDGAIASHGNSLGFDQANTDDLANRLTKVERLIEDRLTKVEGLIEEIGQYSALVSELNLYIVDCRSEIASIRYIRNVAVGSALTFILFCLTFSICIVFFKSFSLNMIASQFLTYSLIGFLAAVVIILSVLLKGAFRTIADRHGDENLPPHIKEIMDGLKPIKDAFSK